MRTPLSGPCFQSVCFSSELLRASSYILHFILQNASTSGNNKYIAFPTCHLEHTLVFVSIKNVFGQKVHYLKVL